MREHLDKLKENLPKSKEFYKAENVFTLDETSKGFIDALETNKQKAFIQKWVQTEVDKTNLNNKEKEKLKRTIISEIYGAANLTATNSKITHNVGSNKTTARFMTDCTNFMKRKEIAKWMNERA